MKSTATLIVLLCSTHAIAADNADDQWDDWEEETTDSSSFSMPITGFAQYLYSHRTVDNNLLANDQIANEARVRLESSTYIGSLFLSYKGDIFYDGVDDHFSASNREAFVGFSPAQSIDVRAGRQILTWGTGDLLFLNDLFPKNWKAFFSGEDQQYLKSPSDAIKASWFNDIVNIDLVWSPQFDPDTYIDGERFSYYSPMQNTLVAAPPRLSANEPEHDISNGEVAARLYLTRHGFEYAGYIYRGYYKTPEGFDPATGELYFPRLNVFGGSIRGQVLGGIGNFEFAYHDSTEDTAGTDPFIPNSEIRFLIGYEKEFIKNLTLAFQAYLEHTQDWTNVAEESAYMEHVPEQNRGVLTSRLTYNALNNNLVWSIFLFASPNDHDVYLLPSVKYRINDALEIASGANYFKGDYNSTMFGQFQDDSNAYVRIKYIF